MRPIYLTAVSALALTAMAGLAGWAVAEPARFAWSHSARHGAGAEHWCDARRLDGALADIRSALALAADQRPAWDSFAATVMAAAPLVCDAARPAAGGVAVELARAETALENGLQAVRALRPAFDGLNAALSEAQRQTLDTLFVRRRRG